MPTLPRLTVAAAATLAVACGTRSDARPLNVLLITLDTTRPDHMGCYGYGKETTPVIDGIASEGVRFERAVSTAGLTPMSHASILTGLNNYRHGMRVFYSTSVSHRLKDSVDTLPEILERRGWRTAAYVSSYPVSQVYGLDQGFQHFDTADDYSTLDLTQQQRHEDIWLEAEKTNTQRRGDATVDGALDWLERSPRDEPWCLWVHLFDVHDFSLVPDEAFARSMGVTYDKSLGAANPDARETMYDPELRFMDDQVGRLVEWLRRNGEWEDTLLVLTADHGQGLKDGYQRHGWIKHRLLYDWCIRVPLVLRLPGGPSGAVVGEQVRTIDILPTVLDVLGIDARGLDGESLLDLVRGERERAPRMAYADALNLEDQHAPHKLPGNNRDNLFCATDGRWKLVYHQRRPDQSELFDLETDPLELDDVASAHPEVVAHLRDWLVERRAFDFEPPEASSGAGPDAESLRALGYGGGYGGDDPDAEPAETTRPTQRDAGDPAEEDGE